jgi:hypothetical protein
VWQAETLRCLRTNSIGSTCRSTSRKPFGVPLAAQVLKQVAMAAHLNLAQQAPEHTRCIGPRLHYKL